MKLTYTYNREWQHRPNGDKFLHIQEYTANIYMLTEGYMWIADWTGVDIGNGKASNEDDARDAAEAVIREHHDRTEAVATLDDCGPS
ncbi:hypothetical protein [Nocardia sp. NPDC057440]|uniref:hypothetical protein n=1 Tax=Nocardia sp. NPDC057440 TaxID=3346134 RepID=UPI00366DC3CB